MAKKMVLVDPRMLDSLTRSRPPLKDPLSDATATLDNEISDVLQNEKISDTDKATQYQQLLQRYLNRHDQLRQRPLGKLELPTSYNSTSTDKELRQEERILESVPSTMKKKAKLLLDHLKDAADVGWNDKTELLIRGRPIEGSNLSDLINDVLRARKNMSPPRGWESFVQVLKDINTPRELIGHQARWDWMKKEEKKAEDLPEHSITPQQPVSSPLVSKRKQRKKKVPKWLEY